MTRPTRRDYLLGLTGGATAALAGCLGAGTTADGANDDGAGDVQASFFVVWDFANAVAGDAFPVENLVPFGQHGHGWEPGPNVQRAVTDARALVYVGEGFQPWADRIVRNLRDDDAGVHVVEAWADVDLLPAAEGEDGHDHAGEDEHHDDTDDHHDEADHHDDTDDHHDEADHHDDTDDHHDDATHEDDHHDGGENHDDHDHGPSDPHFWLDPVRASQAVETVARGLAEVAPDEADAIEANAADYRDRLADLDATFEERLADRTRDTILVAGHNSFRYLGDRYDFRVEALKGLSPDAPPTPQDVRRAQAVVAEHDVEYVLAPVFESDRAARQLVAETSATEVLPLTPVPSLTEAWRDEGWGFVEVMEEVNLPSLARALGAE
jgi:zinc transport system substrate-binding protein